MMKNESELDSLSGLPLVMKVGEKEVRGKILACKREDMSSRFREIEGWNLEPCKEGYWFVGDNSIRAKVRSVEKKGEEIIGVASNADGYFRYTLRRAA